MNVVFRCPHSFSVSPSCDLMLNDALDYLTLCRDSHNFRFSIATV